MAIDLKALRHKLTPVSRLQAEEIMSAGITRHTQRYGKPPSDSIALEISPSTERCETDEENEPTDIPPSSSA
jgi:hypothetical protein